MLLGISWQQHVRNDEVRRLTKQPHLSAIVQSRRLSLFGHIAWMPDETDAKQILTVSPAGNWTRPLGRPRITWMKTIQKDLKSSNLNIDDAVDLAPNRPLWSSALRSLSGACQKWWWWGMSITQTANQLCPFKLEGVYMSSFYTTVAQQLVPFNSIDDYMTLRTPTRQCHSDCHPPMLRRCNRHFLTEATQVLTQANFVLWNKFESMYLKQACVSNCMSPLASV